MTDRYFLFFTIILDFLAFNFFVISLIYDVGSAHPTFEFFIYDVDGVRRIVVFNEVKFPIDCSFHAHNDIPNRRDTYPVVPNDENLKIPIHVDIALIHV
jgi:hypothetical protein